MSISPALFSTALEQNHIVLSATGKEKCLAYLEMMQKWNNVFNLTAITNPAEMIYKHLIDSLAIHSDVTGEHCLDVGTGAGLPGLPLAILNTAQHWTLLDKNNKKTRFLTQVVAELDLNNVTVIQARSEEFKPARKFDTILSRAYASLALFVQSTRHLLDSHGIFIAMKGKYPKEEIDALPQTIDVMSTKRITINGLQDERHLVCLRLKQ